MLERIACQQKHLVNKRKKPGKVFNFVWGCLHTLHLLISIAIRPILELRTWQKQLFANLQVKSNFKDYPFFLECTKNCNCFCPIWQVSFWRYWNISWYHHQDTTPCFGNASILLSMIPGFLDYISDDTTKYQKISFLLNWF